MFFCRYTSSQVYRLRQGFQAQTSPDGTSSTSFRWEAVPMSQMSEALLSFRILQSAHQPPFLLLQALPRLTCTSALRNRRNWLRSNYVPKNKKSHPPSTLWNKLRLESLWLGNWKIRIQFLQLYASI